MVIFILKNSIQDMLPLFERPFVNIFIFKNSILYHDHDHDYFLRYTVTSDDHVIFHFLSVIF